MTSTKSRKTGGAWQPDVASCRGARHFRKANYPFFDMSSVSLGGSALKILIIVKIEITRARTQKNCYDVGRELLLKRSADFFKIKIQMLKHYRHGIKTCIIIIIQIISNSL